MSAPESVRTKDGMVWTLRTVTSSGIALYAPKGVCECPAFVMATLSELAEHGIQSAELAAAVAEHGAFPVPVGPESEALSAGRLAEIEARVQAATAGPWWTDRVAESDGSESVGVDAGDDNWIVPCQDLDPADAEFMAHARVDVPALLAEIRRLTAQRERRRVRLVALQNDALDMRGSLSPNGEGRKVPFPLGETLTPAVDWLIARVAELELERRSTNEALDDAVQELRAKERSDGSYPPALSWLALLDEDDRVEFLDELADSAAVNQSSDVRLAEVERTCATWRLIAEAQHGHNTAPGPDAEDPCHPCGCPKRFDRHADGCPTLADAAADKLTRAFAPVAVLREDPHDGPLHHDYRVGHDLPEAGGAPC
jgi:hypothetical protein